jgi:hypothetical protein
VQEAEQTTALTEAEAPPLMEKEAAGLGDAVPKLGARPSAVGDAAGKLDAEAMETTAIVLQRGRPGGGRRVARFCHSRARFGGGCRRLQRFGGFMHPLPNAQLSCEHRTYGSPCSEDFQEHDSTAKNVTLGSCCRREARQGMVVRAERTESHSARKL